ncbi:MAG: SOS response-associated peptidase [Bacteroidota bacterium]
MCGRYVLIDGKKVIASFAMINKIRDIGTVFDGLPRYNVSPMQHMPVVVVRDGTPLVQKMQWWLIPHWSKDGKVNFSTFNAKAETLEKSRLYSPYFKGSRCLIPADAFYEWKATITQVEKQGKKKNITEKIPFCIRMKDERPFMFAGLFSIWKNPAGEEFPTFTIITTTPNELMSRLHSRMPVILPEERFEQWLDRGFRNMTELAKSLTPYPARDMKAYPVSKLVNNSQNDTPKCITPAGNEFSGR